MKPSANSLRDRHKSTTKSGPNERFLPGSDLALLGSLAARRARLAERRAERGQQ